MRKAQYLAILAAFILSRESIGAQEFPSFSGAAYRDLLRRAFGQIERFAGFLAPSKIRFLTDGGSDGGSSDGGSSDGGSSSGDGGSSSDGGAAGAAGAAGAGAAGAGAGDSSGGTGDSSGSTGDGTGSTGDGTGSAGDGTGSASDGDGASASASDAAAAAASATSDAATSAATDAATDAATATTTTTTTNDDEAAPENDNNAPPSDPNTVTEAPTADPNTITADPTNPSNLDNAVSPLDAIQDEALTDPRGGSDPGPFTGPGLPDVASATTIPPGEFVPTGPLVNVEIHAVIVSAAQSPWDAIHRAPGVSTVTVIGGIVALGKTPIPGEIPGGGPQPHWLRVIPDLRLLNGSMIPPVVPNIIDIRWLNCPIRVEEPDP
jgi:hypothetical protein